jgi:His/Glu/Gln/Arg/opine family amino acid ABC transporter permease subunit
LPYRMFWHELPGAILLTLEMTAIGAALAAVLGLVLALVRRARVPVASQACTAYIYVFRAIPQPPFLLVVYFTAQSLVRTVSPEAATELTLGLLFAPWMAELFRSGFQAVPHGLVEAGRAVGMSHVTVQRRVVVPIAARVMLPAFGQLVIGLMLSTSIASEIGAFDVTGVGRQIINGFFTTGLWVVVAIVYFVLAFPPSRFFAWLDSRSPLKK